MDQQWSLLSGLLSYWCLCLSTAWAAVPNPPTNLTLSAIMSRGVVITWSVRRSDDVHSFRMTVRPLTADTTSDTDQEQTAVMGGHHRNYEVHSLTPDTVYEIFMWAYNEDGRSNMSELITFRTLEGGVEEYPVSLRIHPGEVLIVACLLIAWFCAIAWFLHKWDRIRITQSGDMYKHSPKNLDTIKVVKKATDSVIYKNYTPEVSKTMVARQKRIERMNTMPNIKVNVDDILAGSDDKCEGKTEDNKPKDTVAKRPHKLHPKFRAFSRRITSPVLEVDETKQSSA